MRCSTLTCLLGLCVASGAAAQTGPLYAPHGNSRDGFTTPWAVQPERSAWKIFTWLLAPNPLERRDDPVIPVVANDGRYLAGHEPGATYTWVGHSTFALHEGDEVVLTDPHFGRRALLPKRHVAPGLPIESIPGDAFAVISHNHYDHLDAHTVDSLPDTVSWFVPLGLAQWFRDRGRTRVVELDWWESAQHGGWTITCLPSQHWSRRIGQGANRTLWCAWLLDSGTRRTFFAGDTGYFEGFAEFGRRFGPIDVALMPIGAWAPRWIMEWQHMDPGEAVQATLDLGARHMLGMHWGTFDLTDEPLDQPPEALAREVADRGLDPARFRSLAVGEIWRGRGARAGIAPLGPRVQGPEALVVVAKRRPDLAFPKAELVGRCSDGSRARRGGSRARTSPSHCAPGP